MPFDVTYSARTDSGSANNPALNLTGDPAIELTFVNETATGGVGDYQLDQPSGGGVDPDTQVLIDGTSYSFTYELSGTMPTTKNNGSQQVPDQFEGEPVVIITVVDYPTAGETTRFAFMPEVDATLAEMDDFGNGAIDIQGATSNPPPTAVCFLAGTAIATPNGDVTIENLKVGDLVVTHDHGAMPVRWIGRTEHVWPGSDPNCKPIAIPSGALGNGLPRQTLFVSPQHRIMISGTLALARHGAAEVFVPAKALTTLPGVREMSGKREATYYHLLLDTHAVVFAAGTASESFYPGPSALQMMAPAARTEIEALLPGIAQDPKSVYGPKARPCLSKRQATTLLSAMRQKGRCVFSMAGKVGPRAPEVA